MPLAAASSSALPLVGAGPDRPALARGGTRAVALHALLVRHLLPAAARLAAVRAERGELRQPPPPPPAPGSAPEAWASRAQSIDSLYHELLSPHTAAAFGISGAEGAPTPSTAQLTPAQDGRACDSHQPSRPQPAAAVTNPRDAAATTPLEQDPYIYVGAGASEDDVSQVECNIDETFFCF